MSATSVTLRNTIKSPVTFLIRVITMSVRSVYVLLLYTAATKRIRPRGHPGGGGGGWGVQARVQDGVLTSYMDAAFALLTPEGSEN